MKIIKVTPREFASNSYILTADGETAAVIDPSVKAVEEIKKNGLKCKAVLLTHGHFDHVGGCGILHCEGAEIYCGEHEKGLIFSNEYKNFFGGVFVPEFEISRTFTDGEEAEICGIKFKVMHTPGHSAGSVCYICGENIFTGDTLFCRGIGRYDLFTGNYAELVKSVKKLYALKGDYELHCGHGSDSTLDNERKFNPYVRT